MKSRVIWILSGVCFAVGLLMKTVTDWYTARFNTSFAGLLFTLFTPMKGVGGGFWDSFLPALLPAAWGLAGFLILMILTHSKRIGEAVQRHFPAASKGRKIRRIAGAALTALGFVAVVAAPVDVWFRLNVGEYVRNIRSQTTLYEDRYVAPDAVALTAPAEKPNVIWLVLESMETTYASRADGGIQTENYMPNLTALTRENLSFSNTDKLGGFRSTNNTNWTMAALFAGTSGLPFAFPVDQNSMNKYTSFAPEIVTFGDVLRRDGYSQEFLCGSDGSYGGRALYFTDHGGYAIYDLFEARRQGEIPEDYYVWWGFEDRVLFRIAEKELTRLAAMRQPFQLTLLTVDAHHLGGYVCEECGDAYDDPTANVIACTDRQVKAFVDWCRAQDFWQNTIMVITGDHPRMDTCLTEGVDYRDRTIYNCFLNSRTAPRGGTVNREATMMDLYPTMLSAMGYGIEGDRLGLGTDLFSGRETLAEEMGYEALNEEVQKYSQYFIDHFAK